MTEVPGRNDEDSMNQRILTELKKTNKILTLVNGDKLESQISKFATTPERKKIWVLIDGTNDINELINASGLKKTPVYAFVTALEKAGLIERVRGMPPTRVVDFVPAAWTELLQAVQLSMSDQISSGADKQNPEGSDGGDKNG